MLISSLFAKPPPEPKPANGCYRTPEEIQRLRPEPTCTVVDDIVAQLLAVAFAVLIVFGVGVLVGALVF